MHILYLIFWLKLFIHQNIEITLSKDLHNKVTNSFFEDFKKKEIFLNVTLIINIFFYQNQSKNHDTNNIRQLCIGEDWLILVKLHEGRK